MQRASTLAFGGIRSFLDLRDNDDARGLGTLPKIDHSVISQVRVLTKYKP